MVLKRPAVPVIVGDAPHLRVFGHLGGVFELRRSGERLSTIGRPVLRIASAIWRISVGR